MKTQNFIAFPLWQGLAIVALLVAPACSFAETMSPLVDDFNDPEINSLGIRRQYMSDTVAGGATSIEKSVSDGVLSVSGDIAPPRGQPGWSSSVLLLDPQGMPRDASAFEGIRLRIKVNKGSISVSANSTDVQNFDYHAAVVVAAADNEFHEVKIPFASMKRAWSEQTPLNTKVISGLSIVAFGLQQGPYDFELDEVGFY